MEGSGTRAGNDNGAIRKLLRAAERAGGTAMPREFVAALLGDAAPEDLLRYAPGELAALAAASFAHLQDRTPGKPKIRIADPVRIRGGERLQEITVIDIVNDDMPFLLDSVMNELNEQDVTVDLVAHPILRVERGTDSKLREWSDDLDAKVSGRRESFIHIHLERIDEERCEKIAEALESVLADVRLCVSDWKEMLGRVHGIIEELKTNPSPLPKEEVAESVAFLEWLAADNFTFLGCRDYTFVEEAGREMFSPLYETGRGILRGDNVHVLRKADRHVTTTPELREFMRRPVQLIITKANVRSRVHRRVHMDYVGVKRFGADGRLIGEFRIVGLFTSTAYNRRASVIPYLRRKVEAVLKNANFAASSHSGKALVNVLETYPRDDLFQIDDETLHYFAQEILQLDVRPRVRVLARADRFDRFVSVLVFLPRERYDSRVRERIGEFLASAFDGRVSAFYPTFLDGPLTRVHFIIGRDEGATPQPARAELEAAVANIVRDWGDGFAAALLNEHELGKARALEQRYRGAFPAGYREAVAPEESIGDVRMLEGLSADHPVAVNFYRRHAADANLLNLKIFSRGRPMPLSERVPVLENMGFGVVDEQTFTLEPSDADATPLWLHDMRLARAAGGTVDLDACGGRLESCLMAVLRGRAENDGYNALVLSEDLSWREVALLRTLSRYLRQAGAPFSQDYLWATMVRHAPVAAKIAALFQARFDPRIANGSGERVEREAALLAEIKTALGEVESLDEDRMLQRFVELVLAAVRTNFYQIGADGHPKEAISIKFESGRIEHLPAPKPLYEIFVYSPRVEGVHLRFGKVARGGLRWSDRPQDFRTEVLGLVKAQQVKNAVIVPVGAKGGFVPKRLPVTGGRDAVMAEGTASYDLFITSLLELTDNLGAQGVVPPPNVVRHDGDDPYLVVAADKGTATFSDRANAIALQKGFWLGDAFASGGSAGYDHKAMGITARGAWEAVKRHFRELDTDITTTPFSVAGIGDMSGDVFGNGMLLEKTIRLVAAFDHRDIFIDPDPDPETSWTERKRLFDLPRSSWQDYSKKLLSRGGGVFSRKAKSIALSSQARELLGIEDAEPTPAAVMSAILKMPVDLLWFGGIGTYVRASSESDEKVGDKANDEIRVTAPELRCKAIGEGANLGMTQLGRIEAAQCGVLLNTDAIDNSAGVNSSDVEVNLKIALGIPLADNRLTLGSRNALLSEMTDEVAALVLRNNYLQTLAISLSTLRGADELMFHKRAMQALEARGLLDRAVEFLPSDRELDERAARGQGLTRPELAVLLAYAKIVLYDDLLASDVPDDPYLAQELVRYFPERVSRDFPDALEGHRLRREIISTMLANSIINRGGPSFIVRMSDATGAEAPLIAKVFAAVRDAYGMKEVNGEIDRLDGRVSGSLQLSLYVEVQDLLTGGVDWFLRNADCRRGLAEIVANFRAGIEAVESVLGQALPPEQEAARHTRAAELIAANVPEPLAQRLAALPALHAAPDIVLAAGRAGKPIATAAGVYFALDAFFQLDRLAEAAHGIRLEGFYDRLALDRAMASLAASRRGLAVEILETGMESEAAFAAWAGKRGNELERTRASLHDIVESGLTLSKLAVAVGLLGDLVKE